MSTLEKTINLLTQLPEQKIELIYNYAQFVSSQEENKVAYLQHVANETRQPTKPLEGFRVLQSFAGSLPEDFDTQKRRLPAQTH